MDKKNSRILSNSIDSTVHPVKCTHTHTLTTPFPNSHQVLGSISDLTSDLTPVIFQPVSPQRPLISLQSSAQSSCAYSMRKDPNWEQNQWELTRRSRYSRYCTPVSLTKATDLVGDSAVYTAPIARVDLSAVMQRANSINSCSAQDKYP
ncbi:hypothetical protein ElyMa_001594400 [Elysia marginata]|uniref:Uncharacterized protein n=1 Tax=Elysia marginata TaxID=1093978 RepID=A0AAV4JGD2_9GAST|nr:hypothetical protein ElyMa_001594400 [Elysia marginata]